MSFLLPEQAYTCNIQLRYNDIDALGHVNNAMYVTYLEIARVNYFEHLMQTNISLDKEGIILARVAIDYKQPIVLGDALAVKIWCSKVGSKSFDLAYAIIKQTDVQSIVMATATTVQVCFDYKENKSILIPEKWKEKFTANLFPAF